MREEDPNEAAFRTLGAATDEDDRPTWPKRGTRKTAKQERQIISRTFGGDTVYTATRYFRCSSCGHEYPLERISK